MTDTASTSMPESAAPRGGEESTQEEEKSPEQLMKEAEEAISEARQTTSPAEPEGAAADKTSQ